jgi:hypothetical protein
MRDIHEIFSKKVWFALFNLGSIIYLIIRGTLQWNAVSMVSCGLALLLVNGIALISSRKYGNKYKNWK